MMLAGFGKKFMLQEGLVLCPLQETPHTKAQKKKVGKGKETMFRVKKMFGGELKARSMGAQKTEAICKCQIINKMNKLGMPRFEWISEAA